MASGPTVTAAVVACIRPAVHWAAGSAAVPRLAGVLLDGCLPHPFHIPYQRCQSRSVPFPSLHSWGQVVTGPGFEVIVAGPGTGFAAVRAVVSSALGVLRQGCRPNHRVSCGGCWIAG